MAAPALASPPAKQEFRSLTGLRGLAALWVVSLHYLGQFEHCFPALRRLEFICGKGHLGVDVFFILSGFILCHVYRPLEKQPTFQSLPRFWLLRLARIYPAHLATLLLLMAMVGVARHMHISIEGKYEASQLLPNFTLTHAWPWVEPAFGTAGWNYPSWSVSAEWFAYLIIFPISFFSLKISEKWRISHGIFCYLYLAIWLVLPRHAPVFYTACVMVSLEFLAGCHLYYAFLRGGNKPGPDLGKLFPVLVVFLIVGAYFLEDDLSRITIYLSIPLLLWVLASEKTRSVKWLGCPAFHWLGLVSYSIYLSHAIVQKLVVFLERKWAITQAPLLERSLFFLGIWIVLLAAAAALYHGVEHPSREWIKRRSGKRIAT